MSINTTATCGRQEGEEMWRMLSRGESAHYRQNLPPNRVCTSVPSLFVTGKTSLHSWIPVVSGSDPPLQENPVRGSSSSPSQFSSLCRDTESTSVCSYSRTTSSSSEEYSTLTLTLPPGVWPCSHRFDSTEQICSNRGTG